MSIDMYQASVPVFIRFLENLSRLLDKGEAHAEECGIAPEVLLNYRLYPDMLPLTAQVQIACNTASRSPGRLSGGDVPNDEDDEATFDELRDRIHQTIAYLEEVEPHSVIGSDDRPVQLELPDRTLDFTGLTYLFHFALPNFFFHVTTAHDILRHAGVNIGKLDYMGVT